MKQKNRKPILPKRLCEDPYTKYCREHHGCCSCYVYNNETPRDERMRCWGPWED